VTEFVHLIGAEDVRRASREMQDASERIERAVGSFGEHVDRLIRAMEQDAIERAQAREEGRQ